MRSESHTPISVIKTHFEKWRKENRFSRETAIQFVTEAHEALGFDVVSGIRFDPTTQDAFDRQRINAERVYRWLDDVTTDRNLLPANFIPSILAALPLAERVACVNELLSGVGLVASALDDGGEDELEVNRHLPGMMKETHEALQAVVQLNSNMDEKNLLHTHQEVGEAIHAMTRFQKLVKRAIAVRTKVGQALRVVRGHK